MPRAVFSVMSTVKLDVLTWQSKGIDSVLDTASSGH